MSARTPRATVAVDTSVAVARLLVNHTAHRAALAALLDRRASLSGHALFETYSVLTRLPPGARLSPSDALTLLTDAFHAPLLLPPAEQRTMLELAVTRGIAGGAVYDALVGAAAAHAGVPLLTRDRRALGTYAALDIDARLVAD